jgi:hypothetical protein
VLGEDLAARDPDPVVGRGHVDEVRGVHVQLDAGGLGVGAQPLGTARVVELGGLPALRVAEEELGEAGVAGAGLGDRVDAVDVGSDAQRGHADETRPGLGHHAPAPPRAVDDDFPAVRRTGTLYAWHWSGSDRCRRTTQ